MVTFTISKQLVVTVKYYYENNISLVSRSHVEIVFAFQRFMRKTKNFLEKAITQTSSIKNLFLKVFAKFFFDKVSGWRFETLLKKRL